MCINETDLEQLIRMSVSASQWNIDISISLECISVSLYCRYQHVTGIYVLASHYNVSIGVSLECISISLEYKYQHFMSVSASH